MTRFADLVHLNTDRIADPLGSGIERFVGLEHIEPENLHIRNWGLVVDGVTFTNQFKPGQVLFGKRRAYQRKVAVADFEGVCSSDIYVFESKDPDKLLPELLPFICQSEGFYQYAIKTSAGSLSPRTNWSHLANYEFPLPPLDEQHRIADLLWAADDVIQNWETTKQNAVQLLETTLATTFNLKSTLGDGQTWEIAPLNQVAFLQTGIAKGKKYGKEIETIEMPYLSVLNVQDGYLDLAGVKKIILPTKDVERYLLKSGDIVIAEGGDSDKVGRGAIWHGEIDPCLHQNHVFCIRTNEEKILPEFLSFQMRSKYGKAYFLKSAKKTSNLASINSTQVKQFPVLLCSLDFQKKTISHISQLEKAIRQIDEHLSTSVNLKKSLLAKFFGI